LLPVKGGGKYYCPCCQELIDEARLHPQPLERKPRALPAAQEVFVARTTELLSLKEMWNATTTANRPSVALIQGVPGIGKTAILEELYRWIASSMEWDPEDYWPDAPAGRLDQLSDRKYADRWRRRKDKTPRFLWFGARCNHIDTDDTSDGAIARADLDPWMFMLEGTQVHRNLGTARWRSWIPVLGEVLKSAAMEGVGTVLPGVGLAKDIGSAVGRKLRGKDKELEEALEKLDDLVLRTFGRISEVERGGLPLILSFDDLQWADGRSLAMLLELLDRTCDQPVMVVGTVRSVDVRAENRPVLRLMHQLERRRGPGLDYRVIDVGKMERSAILEQLRGLLGATAENTLLDWLADKSDGMPLFADELARLAVDSALIDNEGRFAAGKSCADLDSAWADGRLPHDAKGVIGERIRRLKEQDAAQHQLLAFGAVQGRVFEDRMLAAVAGHDKEYGDIDLVGVRRLMRRAEEVHDVIHGKDPVPVAGDFRCAYIYTHSLLHDAFLLSLGKDERARCLEVLLDLYQTADDHESPLATMRRLEAADFTYGQLQALRPLTVTEWQLRVLSAGVLFDLKKRLEHIGEAAKAADYALELARSCAQAFPDNKDVRVTLAMSIYSASEVATVAGHSDRARELLEEALPLTSADKSDEFDMSTHLDVLGDLASLMMEEDDTLGWQYLDRRLELARQWAGDEDEEVAQEALAGALEDIVDAAVAEEARLGEALGWAQEWHGLAERNSHLGEAWLLHRIDAATAVASIYSASNLREDASRAFLQLVDLARGIHERHGGDAGAFALVSALHSAGEYFLEQEDSATARPLLEEAIRRANASASRGDHNMLAMRESVLDTLADLLDEIDDRESLHPLLRDWVDLCQEQVAKVGDENARLSHIWSLKELALFLGEEDNLDGARVLLEESVEHARTLYGDTEKPIAEWVLLTSLHALAGLHLNAEDAEAARPYVEEELARARLRARSRTGQDAQAELASSLKSAAVLHSLDGRFDAASDAASEAVALCREVVEAAPNEEAEDDLADALERLSFAERNADHLDKAERHLREAIEIRRELDLEDRDNRLELAESLELLAEILEDAGRDREAEMVAEEAQKLVEV